MQEEKQNLLNFLVFIFFCLFVKMARVSEGSDLRKEMRHH